MIVSLHQPQYLPWPGYFFKILQSESFVLFDTVQYPRSHGGSGKHFGNRNMIKMRNGVIWLTVPVTHQSALLPYSDISIDATQNWARKHWKSIEVAYRAAPFFDQHAGAIKAIYLDQRWERLVDLEESLLRFCFDALKIKTRLVRASCLEVARDETDTPTYILNILKTLGATHYISGQGAGSQRHIRPEDFERCGITLGFYEFTPPPYAQLWGDFIPGLSVLDTLMNCGSKTRHYLEANGRVHWLDRMT